MSKRAIPNDRSADKRRASRKAHVAILLIGGALAVAGIIATGAATFAPALAPPRAEAPQAPPVALGVSSGFKVTYGLKAKANGRPIAGGLRDSTQVRSISG